MSVVDALTDTSMADAAAALPFPPELRNALVDHSGTAGRVLTAVAALEHGDFEDAALIVPRAGEIYLDAILWANRATEPPAAAAGRA
jgi:c-di-GMP-related signal transduction protein